jgi:phage recombination protein Bet
MNTLPAIAPEKPPTPAPFFTAAQLDLLKRTICKGATDEECNQFAAECAEARLSPFRRQIYWIQRRERALVNGEWRWRTTHSTQVSIDGFRLIAQRSGEYAGQLGPQWCGEDEQWHELWRPSKGLPTAARVGVLRTNFEHPLWAVALFDDYAQRNKEGQPSAMWAKMPALMIGKCAEALALRRAFPQELSGWYAPEEMMQASNEPAKIAKPSLAEEMDDQIPEEFADAPSTQSAASATAAATEAPPPQAAATISKNLMTAFKEAKKGRSYLNKHYQGCNSDHKKEILDHEDELKAAFPENDR